MDECCLIFDLKIISKVGSDYVPVCYLNRESNDVTFEIKFHNDFQNVFQKKQIELRKRQQEEWMEICRQMIRRCAWNFC